MAEPFQYIQSDVIAEARPAQEQQHVQEETPLKKKKRSTHAMSVCGYCDKAFESRGMQAHIRSKHSAKVPYERKKAKCSWCPYSSKKTNTDRHKKSCKYRPTLESEET
jgi:hypothetical protein